MRPAVVGELVHGVIGQGYIGVAVLLACAVAWRRRKNGRALEISRIDGYENVFSFL